MEALYSHITATHSECLLGEAGASPGHGHYLVHYSILHNNGQMTVVNSSLGSPSVFLNNINRCSNVLSHFILKRVLKLSQ